MNSLSVECKTKTESDHDKKYGVPSLEDLGKSEKECGPLLFPGGETEALRRLESMMGKKVINSLNIAYNTVKSWLSTLFIGKLETLSLMREYPHLHDEP